MSILDILRRPTREPIFIEPAKWTDKHLRYLQCYFDRDDTIHNLAPADEEESHEELTRRAKSLASHGNFDTLLAYEYCPLIESQSDSKFVFARRYSFLLPFCSYGFRAPGLETDDGFYGKQVLPAFGFTSHTLTQSAREDAFSRSSPHRKPEAKRACAVMQARRAAPQDPFEDPLISACLILMAQSQVKFAQKHPTCLPADKFPVKLFFSSTHDTDALRIYSAEIPTAFLAMIDDPSAPMAGPLRIKCRAVPYRPYETLYLHLWDEVKPLAPGERAERLRALHGFLDEQLRENERIEKIVNGEIEEEFGDDDEK